MCLRVCVCVRVSVCVGGLVRSFDLDFELGVTKKRIILRVHFFCQPAFPPAGLGLRG